MAILAVQTPGDNLFRFTIVTWDAEQRQIRPQIPQINADLKSAI